MMTLEQPISSISSISNGTDTHSQEMPIPLDTREKQEPFPTKALGNIIEPVAIALSEDAVQVPVCIAAASLLTAASIASQPHVNVCVDGRESPISLFLLTIAESGDRKSQCDRLALRPVHECQKELTAAYIESLAEYKALKREYERARRSKNGADIEEPKEPTIPILIASDFTTEAVRDTLSKGLPAIGLVSDEGGNVVNGHSLKDAFVRSLSELSSMWDGSGRLCIRSGSGAHSLYGTRATLHLMIQPSVAEILHGNETAYDQGFLGRCLCAWPHSLRGQRLYREYDIHSLPEYRQFNERIINLLSMPWPLDDTGASGLIPEKMYLSNTAKREYIKFYNQVEEAADDFQDVYAFSGKAAEHALRIAAVLAHFEEMKIITVEHMARGVLIAEWYLLESKRIRRQGMNYEAVAAKRLLKWLQDNNKNEVSATDILTLGPSEFRSADSMHPAMNILELHRWVKRLDKPGCAWRVASVANLANPANPQKQ